MSVATYAQKVLSIVEKVSSEVRNNVNPAQLEQAVLTGIGNGGGLEGVLKAVVADAAAIFTDPAVQSDAVTILTDVIELLAFHTLFETAPPAAAS
jgi:hypothetical protein